MAQGVRVGPGGRRRRIDVGDQPDPSRRALAFELAEQGREQFGRPTGPVPRGGRSRDEHQVAEDAVGALRLIEDDAERPRDLRLDGPREQQLGRPTTTASGLFSSWPAPAANSLRASSLPRRSRCSSVSTRCRSGRPPRGASAPAAPGWPATPPTRPRCVGPSAARAGRSRSSVPRHTTTRSRRAYVLPSRAG